LLAVLHNTVTPDLASVWYRHQQQQTSPCGLIALNEMVIHPASTNVCIMRDSSIYVEYKDNSSSLTDEMTGMSLDEQNVLRHKVLKTANETIGQLDDRSARM
jgi:hypothetical protein